MAVDNQFKETVDALFKGMNGVVSSKTVVGDAIHIGDTIILPLVDVSFAIGAGAFHADKKDRGAGGLGGKMIQMCIRDRHYTDHSGSCKGCCFPEGTYCYRRRHSGTFICGKRESLYLGKTGRYAS